MQRSPSDTPRRATENAFRPIGDDGGLVVLPGRSEVKVLNPVGSRVFELIDGKRTIDDIVRTIADEFEVPPEQAAADVDEFLSVLEEQGMVAPGRPDAKETLS